MSNSSSVGGSGGVDVPSSPYTNGTPDQTGQTGQTNGGRKVTVNPATERTHIQSKPDDTSPPSPLSKRKVARHDGSKKLRTMPGGDGFKPLGGKNNSTIPTGAPRVSVESSEALVPLPPLTQEQQEQKNKLVGAFTTALGFIKQHKNSFAMGGGAVLLLVGIGVMALPPVAVLGIFPAVIGFTMFITGFSFAMTNTENGGSTQPPEPPKNENKEKDDKKEKNGSEEDSSPSSSSAVTPKGHFAKIDHATGSRMAEQANPEETSAEMSAKKQELFNYQQHMVAGFQTAFKEDAERRAVSGEPTDESTISPTLEKQIIDIAAEFAVRAGLRADDDVMVKITESGKLIAKAMADTEGMTLEERQKAFQTLYVSLIQRSGIPEDTIKLLCAGFEDILENQKDLLTDAAKAILSSTAALLKTIIDHQKSDIPVLKTVSLADLEAVLNDIHDPGKNLENIVHMRQLKDAIEAQGRIANMKEHEIEQVKNRLYSDALDLLTVEMKKDDFKTALIAKIDLATRPEDHDFLNKALQRHTWFRVRDS